MKENPISDKRRQNKYSRTNEDTPGHNQGWAGEQRHDNNIKIENKSQRRTKKESQREIQKNNTKLLLTN